MIGVREWVGEVRKGSVLQIWRICPRLPTQYIESLSSSTWEFQCEVYIRQTKIQVTIRWYRYGKGTRIAGVYSEVDPIKQEMSKRKSELASPLPSSANTFKWRIIYKYSQVHFNVWNCNEIYPYHLYWSWIHCEKFLRILVPEIWSRLLSTVERKVPSGWWSV